jgi:hypothetical protein
VSNEPGWAAVIAEEVDAVKSDRGSLRKFGLTMGIALAVLGALSIWRGAVLAPYLLLLAAVFLLAAELTPGGLRLLQRGWMTLAIVLGWVMTRLLLVIVFYVGITPIALIARLTGKRFLELRFDPKATTYWERRSPETRGRERYESQF